MDPTATPGEIFTPSKSSGTRARLVTDGKVTREVRIIGSLGPAYEVFDIQNGGHGEIYFCVPVDGVDPCTAIVCKRLPRQMLFNPVRRRAFLRECVLATRITTLPGFASSHILQVDGLPVLVTAAVLRGDDGVANLRDVIQGPRQPAAVLGFLAWVVAESMSVALHVYPDFVHGDLKPENILLQAGVPLITDLGLASTFRYEWGRDFMSGTPRYLAPEARHLGARLTQATDIYAFGVILQEMLDRCQESDSVAYVAARDLIAELSLQCMAESPSQRAPGFIEIARRLKHTFDSSDPVLEARCSYYQFLASFDVTYSTLFPDFESLARLEEWELLHEVIEAQSADERASSTWQKHGLALTRMGRDAEALESFLTALARAEWEIETTGGPHFYGPDEDALWSIQFDIAVLLINLGHTREAEGLSRELVANAISEKSARRAGGILARALIDSGRLAEGESVLLSTMAQEHDHERLAEGFQTLSLLRLRQWRPYEAIEAMQQAVRHTPGRASCHRRLGELLAIHGELGLAITAFDHAMLCGDQTRDVLAMRLACEIVAQAKELNPYRAHAERQFGKAQVDDAWQLVLDIVANARDMEPVEVAAAVPATGTEGQKLDYGELQVEIDSSGFYTFDYYIDGDETDVVGDLTSCYRQMVTMIASATLRGAPILCSQCTNCGTEIFTNRRVNAEFACVRCGASNHVFPLQDELHRDLCTAIGRALDLTEVLADGQGHCVVIQASRPGTEEQVGRVHEAAKRHGLEPVPADHAAVVLAHVHGVSRGKFVVGLHPIGAIYRFPEGSKHIPRMAPAPVENYLTEVREIFGCPVNSSSFHIDYTREDPIGLIWADRLDRAEEIAHGDLDINDRRKFLILLSQLWLNRGHEEIALRLADEAVGLDGDDENAWLAKGSAEVTHGDVTAAWESLRQALRVNPSSIGATALQAAIENLSGDAKATFTLERSIALGAIFWSMM